jgi:hypothetical protein
VNPLAGAGEPRPPRRGVGVRRLPGREPQPTRFPWTTVAVLALLACLGMYAWAWVVATSAVGVALIEIPLLMLLTTPLFIRASREEPRFDLGGLLALGLVARFAATYYRYTNAADGAGYFHTGAVLAKSFRNLDFGVDAQGPVPGTGGMRIIAGVVEVFTNSSSFATFLVFAWLGFFGCYLCYRAFVTALPEADHRRYALLVFLWPTLALWPSSIGKDCWLLFTLGIAALGAARVLVRRRGGYSLLVLGLIAGSVVRPHVSLLFAIAFGFALLVGRRVDRPGTMTPTGVARIAGLVLLLVLGGYLVTKTADLLDTADIGSSVDVALAENSSRTAQGGSAFAAADPRNPLGYVEAAATIMFRPLPVEVHNAEALATSIETMFLLGLCVASWRRLVTIPRRLRSEPYVALALAYALMFFFAFGTIANFGILARERSMLMPFVFVLLSVTAATNREGPAPAPASRVSNAPRARPRVK